MSTHTPPPSASTSPSSPPPPYSPNRVELVGRTGREPELRYTPSGTPVLNVSLAVTERWTDRDNQKREKTNWFNVFQFGDKAAVAAEDIGKGDLIGVMGKLTQRQWETDEGEKRSKVEVQAFEMHLVRKKKGSEST